MVKKKKKKRNYSKLITTSPPLSKRGLTTGKAKRGPILSTGEEFGKKKHYPKIVVALLQQFSNFVKQANLDHPSAPPIKLASRQ
jgi:hypothetical protein